MEDHTYSLESVQNQCCLTHPQIIVVTEPNWKISSKQNEEIVESIEGEPELEITLPRAVVCDKDPLSIPIDGFNSESSETSDSEEEDEEGDDEDKEVSQIIKFDEEDKTLSRIIKLEDEDEDEEVSHIIKSEDEDEEVSQIIKLEYNDNERSEIISVDEDDEDDEDDENSDVDIDEEVPLEMSSLILDKSKKKIENKKNYNPPKVEPRSILKVNRVKTKYSLRHNPSPLNRYSPVNKIKSRARPKLKSSTRYSPIDKIYSRTWPKIKSSPPPNRTKKCIDVRRILPLHVEELSSGKNREHHNVRERLRREELSKGFNLLYNCLPKTQKPEIKVSKIHILREATRFVNTLKERQQFLVKCKGLLQFKSKLLIEKFNKLCEE